MVDTATNASSALAPIRRSARFGAVLASLPFLALLLNGQWSLVQDQGLLGGFYDAQAHAWLHGRWNVPAGTLGIEGILRHGKTYLYFGPVPALLRLPIALVTHSADGRISQLSMHAAFIVAMVFLVRLVVRIRFLVRGNRPVTGFEIRIVGVTVFALGGASVLVFLAGLAVVYYEAALWGTALTIAAFDAMIDFTTSPRPRSFVIASGFSIAAILSRPSVGAAPAVALALLAVATLSSRTRAGVGLPDSAVARRWLAPLAAATSLSVGCLASVNLARFGTLFSVPFDHQVFGLYNAQRKAALAANHGSLFGVRFVPTSLFEYFRPDALRLTSLFPWVAFRTSVTVIGDVTLATPAPASSVFATMPALTALGVVGGRHLLRHRHVARPDLAALRVPIAASAVAALITLSAAYVAERYLADLFPGLALVAIAGLFSLVSWTETASRWRVRAVVATGSILVVTSLWANLGLGLLNQRLIAPSLDEPAQARFVRLQYQVHQRIPGDPPPDVERVTRVGAPGPIGTVIVVGDCNGVYWSDGHSWRAVARTAATGSWHLRIGPIDPTTSVALPLISSGTESNGNIVGMQLRGDNQVRFGLQPTGRSPFWIWGLPQVFDASRPHDLTVITDPNNLRLRVEVDGRTALTRDFFNTTSGRPLRGAIAPIVNPLIGRVAWRAAVAPDFLGPIVELPADRSFCHSLT